MLFITIFSPQKYILSIFLISLFQGGHCPCLKALLQNKLYHWTIALLRILAYIENLRIWGVGVALASLPQVRPCMWPHCQTFYTFRGGLISKSIILCCDCFKVLAQVHVHKMIKLFHIDKALT